MNGHTNRFQLDDGFVRQYFGKQPLWGPVGYVTYKRTYARRINPRDEKQPLWPIYARHRELAHAAGIGLDDSKDATEEFWLTVTRVVEGTFTRLMWQMEELGAPWYDTKGQEMAQEMFRLMWAFKFLPPGRGLWMMGSPYVDEYGGASLNNCAFVSTKDIAHDFADPFVFLMDMLMLGVGVGGDTRGAGSLRLVEPLPSDDPFVVPDNREGWIELIRQTLIAFTGKGTLPVKVDVSQVRPLGATIEGFGGTAAGPEPLVALHKKLIERLTAYIDKKVDSRLITDIFNLIGQCVVAGNVRRSAEILLSRPDDEEFMSLKDKRKNPDRDWGWVSNNSIFAVIGMDYTDVAKQTAVDGEPGFEWLENARTRRRFKDAPDDSDSAVMGVNPCVEQQLESHELCCLVETFPVLCDHYADYERTLKFAYLYAKTVTLIKTHDKRTNAVVMRNRRIGASQAGVVQNFEKVGRREHFRWCDRGYEFLRDLDKEYSDWLCIPRSKRMTSIKPGGTIPLLPGIKNRQGHTCSVTPGIHFDEAEYYYRTIRFSKNSSLVVALRAAGYRIEDDLADPSAFVVFFPCRAGYCSRTQKDVSMWEQLENAAQMQFWWSDNQVSVTIKFHPNEARDIRSALELYETRLKGVAFLPFVSSEELMKKGYAQPPYQPITKQEYERAIKPLRAIDFSGLDTHEVTDRMCDGDKCVSPITVPPA